MISGGDDMEPLSKAADSHSGWLSGLGGFDSRTSPSPYRAGEEVILMAAADVHRDFRGIAKRLEEKGCSLVRKGNHVEVRTKDGVRVYSLPGRAQRGSGNVKRIERELSEMGLLAQPGAEGRRRRERTPVEEALREAANRAGHRELSDEELAKLRDSSIADPDDPGRGPRKPRHVGVLRPYDGRRSPMPAMRYIGNAAWGDFVVRRLKKHLVDFDTRTQFVQFAIEVAKEREIPAPNSRRGAKRDPWDVERIRNILAHLMDRKNARSLTLQFFSAACDELEGIPTGNYVVDEEGQEVEKATLQDAEKVVGVQVFAEEDEDNESPAVSPEATGAPQKSSEESSKDDHKERLLNILLDKLESGSSDMTDEALVGHIEKLTS